MKKAVAFNRLIRRLTDQALDANNHFIELKLMGQDTLEAEYKYDIALENLGLVLTLRNKIYNVGGAKTGRAGWTVEERWVA